MLVLSRMIDEQIMIGPEVVITVVDLRGDRVRLGIEAPREVAIWRRELYEAITRRNLDHQLRIESEAQLKRQTGAQPQPQPQPQPPPPGAGLRGGLG